MNPYQGLDKNAFWSPAVARVNMFDIQGLWSPAYRIAPHHKVVTFGSCFAQHIGRALRERGFSWHIVERAPEGLSDETARKYNYDLFSARTGNIYTVSQLAQWISWTEDGAKVPDEVWMKDGRYYDPFRPNVEPDGFASVDELVRSRDLAIESLRTAIETASVLVFTLGLTESWVNHANGYEYPMCPGTVAGEFDESQHRFVNRDFPFIHRVLVETIRKVRGINPGIRVLLTVSPVPLTATMSGNHVLVASMESKSVLRAVAGQVSRKFRFVDYFPSYEIINSTPFRGTFFEPNQRSVNAAGVKHVMTNFFEGLLLKFGDMRAASGSEIVGSSNGVATKRVESRKEAVCEEELLEAFATEPDQAGHQ